MPAVSDTSPLLGLSAIGCLELLQRLFGAVFIPQAVLEEIKIEANFRGTPAIQHAIQNGWIKIQEVQNKPLAQALSLELDKGESEAITLAVDLGIEIIVMDERIGRERARGLGLKTVGVLGILLNAKKHGQIDSAKTPMQNLRNEIGFFISAELYQEMLKQAGESE